MPPQTQIPGQLPQGFLPLPQPVAPPVVAPQAPTQVGTTQPFVPGPVAAPLNSPNPQPGDTQLPKDQVLPNIPALKSVNDLFGFLGISPQFGDLSQDFLNFISRGQRSFAELSKGKSPFGQLSAALNSFGNEALPIGLSTLNEILLGQGRTDPGLLNRELADISRTTQGQQQDIQGRLAQLGLSGSGTGQAVSAAVGQAGAEQRGNRIAQENAQQEARKRQDLGLLLNLMINPSQNEGAILRGQPRTPSGPSSQDQFLVGLTEFLKDLF